MATPVSHISRGQLSGFRPSRSRNTRDRPSGLKAQWYADSLTIENSRTRRQFVRNLGALRAGALALPHGPALAQTPDRDSKTPIQHVLISVNENRSFDHYYGYAPF